MILNQSGNLFSSLHPSVLDSRFHQLQRLAPSVSNDLFFKFILFYENLQFLFEQLHNITLAIFQMESLNIEASDFQYLSIIVQDITCFSYFELSQLVFPLDNTSYVFCLLDEHLPYLPEIIKSIPSGSYLLCASTNPQLINELKDAPQISTPYSKLQKSDVFLLS